MPMIPTMLWKEMRDSTQTMEAALQWLQMSTMNVCVCHTNRKLSANSSWESTRRSLWMWLWRISTKLQAKLSSFSPCVPLNISMVLPWHGQQNKTYCGKLLTPVTTHTHRYHFKEKKHWYWTIVFMWVLTRVVYSAVISQLQLWIFGLFTLICPLIQVTVI